MGTCLKFGLKEIILFLTLIFLGNCIAIHISQDLRYILFLAFIVSDNWETSKNFRSGAKTNNRFPIGKIFFLSLIFYRTSLNFLDFSNYHLSKLKHLIFSTLIYHDDVKFRSCISSFPLFKAQVLGLLSAK